MDGIFADCYARWGGRFSLIAPCKDKTIVAEFIPWLKAYDPDIIYSYVQLSADDILDLHERISPAEYIFHKFRSEPRLDVFGFKPSYRFSPLSSLSTIFKLARFNGSPLENFPVQIIDSWHTENPSHFLNDNLGTYHHSASTGLYPPDANATAGLLTIVSAENQSDRSKCVPRDLTMVQSESQAIAQFANKRATSLSIASALFAPKLNIRTNCWSESFNLVVGRSFSDRLLFWNARHLIPDWLDSDLCCLQIAPQDLDDPEFLILIGEILIHRNHVNSGSGGQSQIVLSSTSLSIDELEKVRDLLITTKQWSLIKPLVVVDISEIVPSEKILAEARFGNRFGSGLFMLPDLAKFTWEFPSARPPQIVPDHVQVAPVRQSFTLGYWCTDLILEYDGPGARRSESNRWKLSPRWRMSGAFKVTLHNPSQHNSVPHARQNGDGNLSVFVSLDHPIDTITVPSAYEAMQYAFALDGREAKHEEIYNRAVPENKLAWIRPSNEARYLTGVLGMVGGLQRAKQLLLHPFLRDMFAKLGGAQHLGTDQVTPTINRLTKESHKHNTFDLKDSRDLVALAELIVKAARTIKRPMEAISYDQLTDDWKVYRKEFWKATPQHIDPNDSYDWERSEAETLDQCLAELRQRQMIYQGYQWTCPDCHHRNWVDFSALSSELDCGVCQNATRAPVAISWLFRANEFLIASLRDRSTLSLIWVLSEIRDRARGAVVFVEPTCFGFSNESEKSNAEADLLMLVDGRAILCEVKSSWHGLRSADVKSLVELALRIRPDVALLAVIEKGAGHESELADAKIKLADAQIELEILTLDDSDDQHSSYLSFDAIS
ncbi:MAG: hypothetical protein Q7T57_01625 [Dehalococcoidales bacterium]|nr:hypothetical protein [Dehalococcoidales bacterium]